MNDFSSIGTLLSRVRQAVVHFWHAHPLWCVAGAAGGYILFVVAASVYADALVLNYPPNAQNGGMGMHVHIVETMAKYDTGHYVLIASQGYADIAHTAFLPLYPLVMRGAATVAHLSYAMAGLLASWVFLIAAAIVVYQWVSFELRQCKKTAITPWIVLGLLAIFPTSFYFALPYTESLFVLLSVSALWTYRRGYYWAAALCAALASATRYQGLMLSLFFFADFIFSKDWNWKKLIPTVGGGLGLLAYMTFLAMHFGNPLEFLLAEKQWNRLSGNVILSLAHSFTPVYVWFIPVLVVGLWSVWRYLGKAYFLYCLGFVLLPLASGRLDSLNRYMLCLVPMFLALALLAEHRVAWSMKLLYICSSIFLLGWSLLLFVNGYWVA